MPGPVAGTQVPTYPAGLPLLMAAAHGVAGSDGEYYVVPIAAAILVWATYLLGVRLSTPWGGVIAAAMMASSPPFLMWLVMPMGDIPVAAGWTLALVWALSGGVPSAAAAGAATSLAILIRPNLIPLAAIVAFVIVRRATPGRGRRLLVYGLTAAMGPVAVLLINWAVYGSPFRSGYGDLQALYSLAFVWPNVQRYTTWFLSAQTVVPLAGVAAVLCPRQRQDSATLAAITIGLPVLVLALYLPYTRFEDWSYLRFLLPAYPPLFAGLAIVVWNVAERWRDLRWVQPVLALGVGLLALRGLDYSNAPADLSRDERRYRLAADAAKTMASNTIFVSFQHSGSLRYYTGRDILRWDLMDPASIDAALVHLEGRGFRLVWVGDVVELDTARTRLAGSRFLARLAASGDTRTIAGVRLVDLGAPGQGVAVFR